MKKLGMLIRILNQLEARGRNPQESMRVLENIQDLQDQFTNLQNQVNTTDAALVEQQRQLKETTTKNQLEQQDLIKNQQQNSTLILANIELQAHIAADQSRITFAENTFKLLEDPSKVRIESLVQFDFRVSQVLEARADPKTYLLPVDYKALREAAGKLFESALARPIVPDKFLEEQEALRQQNFELNAGHLGKLEARDLKVRKDEENIKNMAQTVANGLSSEILTELAARSLELGIIEFYRCYDCDSTHIIRRGKKASTLISDRCLMCGSYNMKRRIRDIPSIPSGSVPAPTEQWTRISIGDDLTNLHKGLPSAQHG